MIKRLRIKRRENYTFQVDDRNIATFNNYEEACEHAIKYHNEEHSDFKIIRCGKSYDRCRIIYLPEDRLLNRVDVGIHASSNPEYPNTAKMTLHETFMMLEELRAAEAEGGKSFIKSRKRR